MASRAGRSNEGRGGRARKGRRGPAPGADRAGGGEPGAEPGEPQAERVRLNKLLAECGVASRRRADEMIVAGRVLVDGVIKKELGLRVDPERQRVEVDGVVLRRGATRRRYYLLNKPSGVICTNERRENRPRAIDLVTDRDKGRIYTVGRLDEETEGLILLTNDGDFANRVMHPRYEVPKTYMVKIRGRIRDEDLQKVREGVRLAEGRTAGARVVVRRRSEVDSVLWVTLREGKNREVRRTFARLGYDVVHLRRIRIGPLTDRGIKTGKYRRLTRSEVQELLQLSEHGERAAEEAGGRGFAGGSRRRAQAWTRPLGRGARPGGKRGGKSRGGSR